jgi:hypothetical protein
MCEAEENALALEREETADRSPDADPVADAPLRKESNPQAVRRRAVPTVHGPARGTRPVPISVLEGLLGGLRMTDVREQRPLPSQVGRGGPAIAMLARRDSELHAQAVRRGRSIATPGEVQLASAPHTPRLVRPSPAREDQIQAADPVSDQIRRHLHPGSHAEAGPIATCMGSLHIAERKDEVGLHPDLDEPAASGRRSRPRRERLGVDGWRLEEREDQSENRHSCRSRWHCRPQ